MAPKKADAADEVEKFPVTLTKPARIAGIKRMPGETVDVSPTVRDQLLDQDAIEAETNQPTAPENQA